MSGLSAQTTEPLKPAQDAQASNTSSIKFKFASDAVGKLAQAEFDICEKQVNTESARQKKASSRSFWKMIPIYFIRGTGIGAIAEWGYNQYKKVSRAPNVSVPFTWNAWRKKYKDNKWKQYPYRLVSAPYYGLKEGVKFVAANVAAPIAKVFFYFPDYKPGESKLLYGVKILLKFIACAALGLPLLAAIYRGIRDANLKTKIILVFSTLLAAGGLMTAALLSSAVAATLSSIGSFLASWYVPMFTAIYSGILLPLYSTVILPVATVIFSNFIVPVAAAVFSMVIAPTMAWVAFGVAAIFATGGLALLISAAIVAVAALTTFVGWIGTKISNWFSEKTEKFAETKNVIDSEVKTMRANASENDSKEAATPVPLSSAQKESLESIKAMLETKRAMIGVTALGNSIVQGGVEGLRNVNTTDITKQQDELSAQIIYIQRCLDSGTTENLPEKITRPDPNGGRVPQVLFQRDPAEHETLPKPDAARSAADTIAGPQQAPAAARVSGVVPVTPASAVVPDANVPVAPARRSA